MTAKESVLELLKRRKLVEESGGNGDAQQLQAEWLADLRELMSTIHGWLADAQAQGLVIVRDVELTLSEDRIGSYVAPGMKLVMPQGDVVTISPRGLFVIGGEGRVDVECTPRKAILLRRSPQSWRFAELSRNGEGWSFKDFTEESFWEVLRALVA